MVPSHTKNLSEILIALAWREWGLYACRNGGQLLTWHSTDSRPVGTCVLSDEPQVF
jgi:hypothetical protein